ncbi:MAG: tRNA (adenosine(37)-N6)-threonylcarbamoyltransferase complex ATPase subunit type 1 TsaE [Actinomycetaceae bacterium]|nr:tRNA (adenosine(37)-N6)-threonylcarbamoyltransferase complex ATPase subunit type 1 TsaE [Actinomycetaceae bacterium]
MFSITAKNAGDTQELGAALANFVRGGDLIMLTGDLGTGKTTFTQGLGRAMGVKGRVASPTFIIARVHQGTSGPDLVHVDAYRIEDLDDLETLDLDTALEEAVVVVEWGEGKTEALTDERLEVVITNPADISQVADDLETADSGVRELRFNPVGLRWQAEDTLEEALRAAVEENYA